MPSHLSNRRGPENEWCLNNVSVICDHPLSIDFVVVVVQSLSCI